MTAKQEHFCAEYAVDYNGTQAAIRAGYSEKNAANQASRMLRNAEVLARVRELQREQVERLAVSTDFVVLRARCVLLSYWASIWACSRTG